MMKNLLKCLSLITIAFAIGSHQLSADHIEHSHTNAGITISALNEIDSVSRVKSSWFIPHISENHASCLISLTLSDKDHAVFARIGTRQHFSEEKGQTSKVFYDFVRGDGEFNFVENFAIKPDDKVVGEIVYDNIENIIKLSLHNKNTGQEFNINHPVALDLKLTGSFFLSRERKNGLLLPLGHSLGVDHQHCDCTIGNVSGPPSKDIGKVQHIWMYEPDNERLLVLVDLYRDIIRFFEQ